MTATQASGGEGARIPAYILAGGDSQRFGSDKARVTLHGTPLIRRVSDRLDSLGFRAMVVGKRDEQFADLGLDTIGDIEPGRGPVGGLWTALKHRQNGWILLCSCDMLAIDSAWITALLGQRRRSPGADAVAARGGFWQPFPALYHTRLLSAPYGQGAGSFQELLNAASVSALSLESLPAVRQANTPEELRAWERG